MMAFSSVQESLQMHAHISQGNVFFFLDGRQCGHCNGPNYTFHYMLQGKTFERILPMPVRLHLTTMMCFFCRHVRTVTLVTIQPMSDNVLTISKICVTVAKCERALTAVREFLRPKEGVLAISSRYFQY